MSNTIEVKGFKEFIKKVTELEEEDKNRPIYCLFCGSKDAAGKSWCPDCVTAEPVVKGCLKDMPDGSVFIYCMVGERDYWKNKGNDFRVDPRLKLTGVPTFMRWGEPQQKLVEEKLFQPNLINMMFDD